jgi:hypothetical protein
MRRSPVSLTESIVTLLLLELRRQRPMLVRMIGLTVFVAAVFLVAGKRTAADQLALVLGSGLGVVLIVPLGIVRDKMEGTLELLCGLPVAPRAIAASRILAGALLPLPWAAGAGLLALGLPPAVPLDPFAVGALAWCVMLLLSACGTAILARCELERVLGAPFVGVLLLLVLLPRALRWFARLHPGFTPDRLRALLQYPAAPALCALGLAAIIAAWVAVSLEIASSAFATYDRDTTRR